MAEKLKRKAGVLHSLFTGNTEHRLIFFHVIFFLICFSDLQMPFGIHISSFGGILILFRTHLDLLNYNTNKLLAQWLKS